MSENARMGVILTFFVLMGIGIWALFSGGDDTDNSTDISSNSVSSTQATDLPDMGYPPVSDSDDPELTEDEDIWPTDEETPYEEDSVSKPEDPATVKGITGSGKITGKVIMDDGSNLPDNIVVTLHFFTEEAKTDLSIDTVIQTTDANEKGEYTFERLPMGTYTLLGNAEGYTALNNWTLNKEYREGEVDLTMYPESTISGVVVNAEGLPIPEAHVSVAGYLEEDDQYVQFSRGRTRTHAVPVNELGKFTLRDLPVEPYDYPYKLLAKAPGYSLTVHEDTVKIWDTGITIVMETGSNVSGLVLNALSQEPMPGIELKLNNPFEIGQQKTTTAQDGTFSFSMVSSGEQFIINTDGDMVFLPGTNKLDVQEGEDLTDIVLEMNTGASISGRIYNKDTGNGISGATVSVYPQNIEGANSGKATTNARGEYAIAGLYEGSYEVQYNQVKGYSQYRSYEDRKNVFLRIAQETTGVDFALEQGITISGIVVDQENKPVKDARIRGNDSRNHYDNASSDDRGRFTLAGFVSESTVKLTTRVSDFAAKPIEVKIEENNVVDVRIELETAAKISGIIVDTSGNPKPNALVFTSSDADTYGSNATSKGNGTFTLEGLTADTYAIKPVIGGSWNSSSKTLASVTVKTGEHKQDVRLVWDLDEGGMTISGRVTDDQGDPINNVRIYSYSSTGGSGYSDTRTDEFGDYTIKGLKEGQYQIQFNRTGYASGNLQSIPAGSTNADITLLRTGTITGRIVTAQSNEPIKAFTILQINGVTTTYQSQMERQFKSFHHDDGFFTLENVEPGSATLFVRSQGYAETSIIVDGVTSAETVSDVLIKMESGNPLTGTVTNQQGEAVRGAFIFVGEVPRNSWERDRGGKTSTNASGEFTLDGLPNGEVIISAYHSGYMSDTVAVNISSTSSHVDLILSEGARVEGYVTLDGEPLPNANIYASVERFSVQGKSDSDGFYQLKGLPAGKGHIQTNFSDNGNQRNMSTQFEAELGMVTEYNFEFENANSSVEGYIMVSETETSAGNVNLSVDTGGVDEFRNIEVGSDGYYLFEGLPAGTVSLRVRRASIQTQKQTTGELAENQLLRLDVKLYGGATLQCFVQNIPTDHQAVVVVLSGKLSISLPLTQETVMELEEKTVQSGLVLPEGTTTMSNLEPGDYTILAIAFIDNGSEPNFEEVLVAQTTISIAAEGTTNINLSF